MLSNSSSSSSSSFLPPPPPPLCSLNSSLVPDVFTCLHEPVSATLLTALTCTNLLLFLPLYVLTLWEGFQRWRRHVTASHADVFTYSMVAMEIITLTGIVLENGGMFACSLGTMLVGYFCLCMSYPAQTCFHCLTCVERYLAVVHPITYRGLKQAKGVRIRNLSVAAAWLLCFVLLGMAALTFPSYPGMVFFFLFAVALIVVIFCSISVLFVLIRHGMGTDQTKRRAFGTIMAITGALLMRFSGLMVFLFAFTAGGGRGCRSLLCGGWLCLPSSLVLPLLFLHRTGALTCSRLKASEN